MANRTAIDSQDVEAPKELTLNELLEVLLRNRKIILVVAVFGLLLGVLLSFRARKFTATGEIRIQPGTASMYRTSATSLVTGDNADKIASEATILQSRTLYLQVAKELDLVNNSDFWESSHLRHRSLDDPLVRERTYRRMKSMVSVTRAPREEILSIACTTTSPPLSAKIVNTLINDYVAYLFQMRYGATQRASGWLIGQLSDLKVQIEKDQTSIIDLQAKLGVLSSDEKSPNFLFDQSLSSIDKASSEATIDRIVAEAKLRFLQDSDPNLIEGEVNLLSQGPSSPAGLLQTLRDSQAKAAADYSRLLAQTGPNFPEVKQARAQLDEINKQVKAEETRIINQAKLSYQAASANEDMTSKELQQKKVQAFQSRDEMVRYMILLHDYDAHRTLYEGLVARLREAGITSGMEAGEIDIVDLADLPAIPGPPSPLMLIGGGLIAGFVLGCIFAFLFEVLDTQIKTVEQAERATGLTQLGLLPHFLATLNASPEARVSPLLVDVAPKSRYAESLQTLRTNLMMSRPGDPPRVIMLTSAVPGEGKSTTSMNLAATLARHGSKVLLIDCDLRRGTLAARLGLSSKVGLSNVLTNSATLDQAVQSVPGNPHLFFLADGLRPPDPAVLMSSTELGDVLRAASQRYDFVVLDSTPGLGLSDALNTGQLADAVLLVVRQRHSNRKAVTEAAKAFKSANLPIVGFTLNDVSSGSAQYGYGYGSYYEEPEDKQSTVKA